MKRAAFSATQTQSLDERLVAGHVFALEIVQQAPALANDPEKTAPGVVILLMDTEVVRQSVDPLSQKGSLHFGRTRVSGTAPEVVYNFFLDLSGNQT